MNMCPTHLSLQQVLEDVSTERKGHDLCVQETETNEPTNITISIQPLSSVCRHPGGIETYLPRLVEQGRVKGRRTPVCVHV